jgi:hypothetical protein
MKDMPVVAVECHNLIVHFVLVEADDALIDEFI